jgi:hypothetical protein
VFKKSKILQTLIVTVSCFVSISAQSGVLIANQHPIVGDEIVVYNNMCPPLLESIVEIEGQNIKVFASYIIPPGLICPSPPFPNTMAVLTGLSEGIYNLDAYVLIPPFANFPPLPADYPLYYDGSVQFEVFGPPAVVDSTSNLSLMLLFALMLFVGLFMAKKNRVLS